MAEDFKEDYPVDLVEIYNRHRYRRDFLKICSKIIDQIMDDKKNGKFIEFDDYIKNFNDIINPSTELQKEVYDRLFEEIAPKYIPPLIKFMLENKTNVSMTEIFKFIFFVVNSGDVDFMQYLLYEASYKNVVIDTLNISNIFWTRFHIKKIHPNYHNQVQIQKMILNHPSIRLNNTSRYKLLRDSWNDNYDTNNGIDSRDELRRLMSFKKINPYPHRSQPQFDHLSTHLFNYEDVDLLTEIRKAQLEYSNYIDSRLAARGALHRRIVNDPSRLGDKHLAGMITKFM